MTHLDSFEDYHQNEEWFFKKKNPIRKAIDQFEYLLNQLPIEHDQLYFEVMDLLKPVYHLRNFEQASTKIIELIDYTIQRLGSSGEDESSKADFLHFQQELRQEWEPALQEKKKGEDSEEK